MILALLILLNTAVAGTPVSHELKWDLTVDGSSIGKRTMTVKFLPSDEGMLRILESWTEIDGKVGPIWVQYIQRLTAHAGNEPASFHAVIEENGNPREVQGRYTPDGWWVTNADAGRSRTVDVAANRIDLSSADLVDPESRMSLGRFAENSKVRLLSAETGDIWEGVLTTLGPSTISIDKSEVPVVGYHWDGPQGASEFFFSDEGYLVRYKMRLYGLHMQGTLVARPPGGIDEFAVVLGRPAIEEFDL